jgi:Protein kinase domain
MVTCPGCGAVSSENGRFCSSCGRAIAILDTPTLEPDRPDRAVVAPTPVPLSSRPVQGGGFSPGTVIIERYRIVALLGRGGMGEVYQAEDLKLGNVVALKFLPAALQNDGAALAGFHAEVRNARQVSHPNVCRVYDIGDVDGKHFLTMEYIDGEDLASLLRRIGRLPADKALETAHQICAGLAAAHDCGLLHRDLKPANIMLDGRGRVRITDFGLALSSADATGRRETAGTPAYMAPEQIGQGEASVRSDIYSLGLLFYQLFTGRLPYQATTPTEWRRAHLESSPRPPSVLVKDIDPAVEAAILRCLQKDPALRPSSVRQVAAAFPGGDPLAAALAAGETPSPEMVAAAGEEGALGPAQAWLFLTGVAIILLLTMMVAQRGMLINQVPAKAPALLSEQGRRIASSLGYTNAVDDAYWFDIDDAFYTYSSRIVAPKRYLDLAGTYPSPLEFWYRQSPHSLQTTHIPFQVTRKDPELFYSGETKVGLDSAGRLNYFAAVGPQDLPAATAPPPDWQALFANAELDWSHSRSIPATWLPDVPSDQSFAWESVSGGRTVRVAAATYRGRVVFFRVFAPWSVPERFTATHGPLASRFGFTFFVVCALAVFVLCFLFARKNLRLGRGDRRGALRSAGAFFVAIWIGYALSAHYSRSALWIFNWVNESFASAAGAALEFGFFYLALEPYVRRKWPEMLISWSRMLAGGWKDPLVGRDLLIGSFLGAVASMTGFIRVALPYWFSVASITSGGGVEDQLGTVPAFFGLISLRSFALINTMGTLAILFISTLVTRKKWIGITITGLFLVIINLTGENLRVELILVLAFATVMLYSLLRFGLLSSAVSWIVSHVLFAPLTTDFSRWYAWRGLFTVGLVLACALYGFKLALARQPAFGRVFEE